MFRIIIRFCILISAFILAGCRDAYLDNLAFSGIVKSNQYEERVEIIRSPVFNCKSRSSTIFLVERQRTIEKSISIDLSGQIQGSFEPEVLASKVGELSAAIGGAYGWNIGDSITDSSGFQFTVAPGEQVIYWIAWHEKWEQGLAQVAGNNQIFSLPYSYLVDAQAEISDITYLECNEPGYATATAIALQPVNSRPLSYVPPLNTSIPSTPISINTLTPISPTFTSTPVSTLTRISPTRIDTSTPIPTNTKPPSIKTREIPDVNISSLSLEKKILTSKYGFHGLDSYFDGSSRYIAYGEISGNSSESSTFVIYNLKEDKMIRITSQNWDIDTNFFGNGNVMYSNGDNLYIFDEDQNLIHQIPDIYHSSISKNENFLVGYNSRGVQIFDVNYPFNLIQSETVSEIDPHQAELAVSENENFIAIAGGYEKGLVVIYDRAKNVIIEKINTSSQSGAYSPIFFKHDRYLAVGGGYDSGRINIIETSNWTIVKTLSNFKNYVYTIDVSPDGKYLVAGGYDNQIKIFDTDTWTEIQSLNGLHRGVVEEVKFTDDMKYLISASEASGFGADILIHRIH